MEDGQPCCFPGYCLDHSIFQCSHCKPGYMTPWGKEQGHCKEGVPKCLAGSVVQLKHGLPAVVVLESDIDSDETKRVDCPAGYHGQVWLNCDMGKLGIHAQACVPSQGSDEPTDPALPTYVATPPSDKNNCPQGYVPLIDAEECQSVDKLTVEGQSIDVTPHDVATGCYPDWPNAGCFLFWIGPPTVLTFMSDCDSDSRFSTDYHLKLCKKKA